MTPEFWQQQIQEEADYPELSLLPKPCADCAVVCRLYDGYSNALKSQTEEVQRAIAKKWFCHNTPSKACRGNADNLGIEW